MFAWQKLGRDGIYTFKMLIFGGCQNLVMLIFIINSFTVLQHNTSFALRICTKKEGWGCSWVFISRLSREPVWCFSCAPSSKERSFTAGRRRCRRERVLLVLVSPHIELHEKKTHWKPRDCHVYCFFRAHEDYIDLSGGPCWGMLNKWCLFVKPLKIQIFFMPTAHVSNPMLGL